MDRVEDDSWVREFDVSNPQKTQAGYTVYRVSSKVAVFANAKCFPIAFLYLAVFNVLLGKTA